MSFTLLQDQLQSVLATLSEREAGVVRLRFGLTDGQPRTLDEIGQVYGVTRERIRQIESKTMSKLRHPSRSQVLRRLPGLTGEQADRPGPRPPRCADAAGGLGRRRADQHVGYWSRRRGGRRVRRVDSVGWPVVSPAKCTRPRVSTSFLPGRG